MKYVLDPVVGGKVRAVILLVVAVAVAVGQAVQDWQAAGWVLTVPVVLSMLAHFTNVGNAPPPAE